MTERAYTAISLENRDICHDNLPIIIKLHIISKIKMDDLPKDKQATSPDPYYYRSIGILRLGFWIVLVCALGFLALNQFLEFTYNSAFLQKPCGLCADLNPEVKECIDALNTKPSYPKLDGEWSDPFEEEIIDVTIKPPL